MPFFVAERKQFGGKQNAKLQTIKTALTGKINVSGITFYGKQKSSKIRTSEKGVAYYTKLHLARRLCEAFCPLNEMITHLFRIRKI